MKWQRGGQSLVEYVIIAGIAVTAVTIMAPSLKRGTQRVIKATADQLAAQQNAEQDYNEDSSHMESSFSSSFGSTQKAISDQNAGVTVMVNDTSQTFTNTITNGGTN